MPRRNELFAQLDALGLDVSPRTPVPDLTRVGLVYVLANAEDRGVIVPTVQRAGRMDASTITATHYSGALINANTRTLRILNMEPAGTGVGNYYQGIFANALVPAFDGTAGTVQTNAEWRDTEPEDLNAESLITTGAWLGASRPWASTITDSWPGIFGSTSDTREMGVGRLGGGVIVPPGHTLVTQHVSASTDLLLIFWLEELGQ